jgi:phage terminase large subunit-like protein
MQSKITSKDALLAEIQKRKVKADRPKFVFTDFCFDKQVGFFRGKGTRFRNAVCSRRAGKTVGIVADMLDTCQKESEINLLYITITQQQARAIIWSDLLRLIEDYSVECKVDNTRLTVSFPNKSRIYIAGAKDRTEIEKFRGWKLRKCYIDECQSFRTYIKELINDIIIPALRDKRGELYLTGTPGPVKAGVFYEYSQSKNWRSHHWTAFDNPYMHDPPKLDLEEVLREERVIRGIDESDPSYIRETFGKWIEDSDALVYKFNRTRNIYTTLPTDGEWSYIVGVDIGYNDSDAIAVIGFNSHHKKVYLVDEHVKNKQNISQLVEVIQYYKDQYNPIRMVMDAGALGKKIQEELRFRHGLHLEAAEKTRKVEFIELLNDDLRTERFKAFENSLFQEDCMLVQWDKDSKIRNPEKPKISDTYHSDICDAVLYAWRECKHYLSEKPVKAPVEGTNDYMKELENREAEDMQRKKEDPYAFELEKQFEEDMDEFENIIY